MPQTIRALKGKRKITALTAYDYPMAKILSRAGVDILLVGDSLGMVVLGFRDTHSVTLADIIRHGQAVCRGNKGSLVVLDMPIGTCDTPEEAVKNCQRVCGETGARAVKIEGKAESVRAVCQAGISVMGHTGLKPQEVVKYTVQGADRASRKRIVDEARALEQAGAFSLVLECVPSDLGKEVTDFLSIPVIGIGAGPHTDGQILVSHDMLGFSKDIRPRFVRRYADLSDSIFDAAKRYNEDVKRGNYPAPDESYGLIEAEEFKILRREKEALAELKKGKLKGKTGHQILRELNRNP